MSKRAPQFERRERDYYPTPREAVLPLLSHLPAGSAFAEPCAGDGALIDHLEAAGHRCGYAGDIEPRRCDIHCGDALALSTIRLGLAWEKIITKPPWDRKLLHPLIVHLSAIGPTWLLFDADWMHTRQAAPYLPLCRKIVSVGRVKWIPDSPFTDNCAWHLFDAQQRGPTEFVGRAA